MRFFVVMLLMCLAVLVYPAIKPVWANENTPAKKPRPGFSCLAGRPGIPGIPGQHGHPGAPGRDGRDGRDGSQAKLGPRGFNGTTGKQGAPGAAGPQGPRGAKGDAGPKIDPGVSGLSSHSNWKECSWTNMNEGKDIGMIKDCVFQKKYTDSVLHVYWNGDFRIYNCDACCKRWFFTFNSAECKVPRAIDGVVYIWKGKGTDNLHRVRHIEGHCDKIPKGQVRVGFNVGNCVGYGNADAFTGWNSNSRIFIAEVPRPQA